MLTDDELCKDNLDRLSKAFVYITRVYYGLNPENVADDLYRLVIQTICDRYKTLTFTELNLAYSERTIEKKQGSSLTKDELMQPIEDLMHKKGIVLMVQQREKEEFEKQQAEKDKIKAEYLKAKELYFESMGTGLYQGSVFQASMIMEAFAEHLSDQEKIEIGKQAIEDYKEQVGLFGTEESMFYGTDVFQVPQGTGHYSNGKQRPKHHYFISMRVINNALQRQTVDGLGWKFIEG